MLAQCDGQIVRQLVQYGDREAETVVRLKSAKYFRDTLFRDTLLKNVHETLLAAYLNCGGDLEFRHDSFSGYGMFYKGSNILSRGTLLRKYPYGFTCEIPSGVTDLSVLYSEKTGRELLMLGPLRFVNSDCNPNCEYDFTSDSKVVRLEQNKKFSPVKS